MTDAVLVLEDGRTFRGRAYGAEGSTLGEIVFNTGMTGYQETLTDPSYHRQIVVMTAPHIGNTGVNDEDAESRRSGSRATSSATPRVGRRTGAPSVTLDDDLVAQGIVGISEIDTRALTRHLRDRGVMRAGIFSGDALLDETGARAPTTSCSTTSWPRPRWPAPTWPARCPPTTAYVVSRSGSTPATVAGASTSASRR